jgi:3-oxoacyl-(acyl-carrier-protein) synthase
MAEVVIIAGSSATEADAREARLGNRFGRMDLASQLALVAVERLNVPFDTLARDRVGLCLVSGAGSLTTDADFWDSRLEAGGPSPTLFTYTLPSAPLGELAIRHQLTGPNLCLVGGSQLALPAAVELIECGEADSCICVACEVVGERLSALTGAPFAARAYALYLARESTGSPAGGEFGRDMAVIVNTLRAPTETPYDGLPDAGFTQRGQREDH